MSLIQDLQHSFRLLRRAPGFAAAALVTLALAIGANTAVFSVVYGVLLRPLPYADAGRLVILSEEHPGGAALVRTPRLSNLTFHAWKEGAATLDGIGAFSSQSFIIGRRRRGRAGRRRHDVAGGVRASRQAAGAGSILHRD